MDVTPLIPAGRQIIEAYGDGGFRVSGQRYEGSLLVFPGHCLSWPLAGIEALEPSHFYPIIEENRSGDIQLLLLGCGAALQPISREMRQLLKTQGIVIEPMDTGAACRTYNVLLAEGRKMAAALIAV